MDSVPIGHECTVHCALLFGLPICSVLQNGRSAVFNLSSIPYYIFHTLIFKKGMEG